MEAVEPDLWELTRAGPQIDPDRLAAAVERQVLQDELDFRTRLLIRDSIEALSRHWGPERLRLWLERSPAAERIGAVRRDDLGESGFPSLAGRLVEATRPEQILQFLRELGTSLHRPVTMYVGRSAALLVTGTLERHTEDIDVVDEVPVELREERGLLDRLTRRYGLHLAHFQSHYLPDGWAGRVHSLGTFGSLTVLLVDAYDVVLSKLFSSREKDRDDVRVLTRRLDKQVLTRRLISDARRLSAEATLRNAAATNWYIVFGESLPVGGPETK